jgi:hypothetical protein
MAKIEAGLINSFLDKVREFRRENPVHVTNIEVVKTPEKVVRITTAPGKVPDRESRLMCDRICLCIDAGYRLEFNDQPQA